MPSELRLIRLRPQVLGKGLKCCKKGYSRDLLHYRRHSRRCSHSPPHFPRIIDFVSKIYHLIGIHKSKSYVDRIPHDCHCRFMATALGAVASLELRQKEMGIFYFNQMVEFWISNLEYKNKYYSCPVNLGCSVTQ